MKIKKSNKLILLVIALAVSIPLIVAMAFRVTIKKGNYVILHFDQPENRPELQQKESLSGAKIVHVTGLPGSNNSLMELNVIVAYNGQSSFLLQKKEITDSLTIKRSSDTIWFRQTLGKFEEIPSRHYNRLSLYLNLPEGAILYAENCTVHYPSVSESAAPLNRAVNNKIHLSNNASLEIGNAKENSTLIYTLNKQDSAAPDKVFYLSGENKTAFDSTFVPMGNLSVTSRASSVKIIQPVTFNQLHLQLDSLSLLDMSYPFHFKQLSGDIHQDAQIKGVWGMIQSISPLVETHGKTE